MDWILLVNSSVRHNSILVNRVLDTYPILYMSVLLSCNLQQNISLQFWRTRIQKSFGNVMIQYRKMFYLLSEVLALLFFLQQLYYCLFG